MFPKMLLVRQKAPCREPVGDMREAFQKSLSDISFDGSVFAGKKTGIAVGSRGINREGELLSLVVRYVKENGGFPYIFAAMGSHGEASSKGQREILESLGISEASMGCPVETCAESRYYGETAEGLPVYGNILPFSYDSIILVNRIKMHTDFEDVTESGLFKILAIGVGNPEGCLNVHRNALKFGYGKVIRDTAKVMLEKLPVVLGFMLTENWKSELDKVVAVRPPDFFEKETLLLSEVKAQSIKLPVKSADALILNEIGKNISGSGMDTKTVGRIRIIGQPEPKYPKFTRIAVLDITDESHGNALGIGLADMAPVSVLEKINLKAMAINGCSSMCPEQAMIPALLETDEEVFRQSLLTAGVSDIDGARAVYIQNTNLLELLAVSERLYEDELKTNPFIERVGDAFNLKFDAHGRLLTRWNKGRLQGI